MNLNTVYISCLIGTSIVAIYIVLLFRHTIDFIRHRKYFNIIIKWLYEKLEGPTKKLKAASIIGLISFVGVTVNTGEEL